jgi:hypothetical protein
MIDIISNDFWTWRVLEVNKDLMISDSTIIFRLFDLLCFNYYSIYY